MDRRSRPADPFAHAWPSSSASTSAGSIPRANMRSSFPSRSRSTANASPRWRSFFAAAGPDVRFNIEIKTDPAKPDLTVDPVRFAQLAVEAIRLGKAGGRSTIQSFDWRGLIEARRLAPEIATGCLSIESNGMDTVRPRQRAAVALAGRPRPRGPGRLPAAPGQAGGLRRLVAVLAQRHTRKRQGSPGAWPESTAMDREQSRRHDPPDRHGSRRPDHRLSRSRIAASRCQRAENSLAG